MDKKKVISRKFLLALSCKIVKFLTKKLKKKLKKNLHRVPTELKKIWRQKKFFLEKLKFGVGNWRCFFLFLFLFGTSFKVRMEIFVFISFPHYISLTNHFLPLIVTYFHFFQNKVFSIHKNWWSILKLFKCKYQILFPFSFIPTILTSAFCFPLHSSYFSCFFPRNFRN